MTAFEPWPSVCANDCRAYGVRECLLPAPGLRNWHPRAYPKPFPSRRSSQTSETQNRERTNPVRISELIEALKAAQGQVGDVPVAMPDEMEVLDIAIHKDAVIISDYSPDGK